MREHSQNICTLETLTDMPPSTNGNGNANGNATTATGLTSRSSYGSGGSAVHSYEVRQCRAAAAAAGAVALLVRLCQECWLDDSLVCAAVALGACYYRDSAAVLSLVQQFDECLCISWSIVYSLQNWNDSGTCAAAAAAASTNRCG
jgi:hypothetical protein